jgi:Glycosyl hydrolase family 76
VAAARSVAPLKAARRWCVAACVLAAALALTMLASAPSASAARLHRTSNDFLTLAKKGIHDAHTNFWNSREQWYNDRLGDGDQYPQATVWSIVPMFEAVSGVAIADPSKSNRKAVRTFATHAERYWNGDLRPHGGYSPYPGDHGAGNHVWYDDNSWWGLAFVDAYKATHNSRFLGDAKRALDYVDASGWDGGSGMWWESQHTGHSMEALAAATALAAEIYEQGGGSRYRKIAYKYIGWANSHAMRTARWEPGFGLYESRTQPIMTYVEGAMLGAHLALCHKGDQNACARAEEIGASARQWWPAALPDFGPQFDTIFFRYVVQLGAYDGDPQWWDWARQNADAAIRHAKVGDLYLKFWDGSSVTARQHSSLQMRYGQIQTHGAAVSLFAWLAAVKRP